MIFSPFEDEAPRRRDDRDQDEVRKRRRPKKVGEVIDLPRRYIVKGADGVVKEVDGHSSSESLKGDGKVVRLMGTHETLNEARRRCGWAA